MLYKAQIKNWAYEQALMTWRAGKPQGMPNAEDFAAIEATAEFLYDRTYDANTDWLSLRNQMAKILDSRQEIDLKRIEEFKDYISAAYEQLDAAQNPAVARVANSFRGKQ